MGNPTETPVKKSGPNPALVIVMILVVTIAGGIGFSLLPPPKKLVAHEPPRAVQLPHESVSLTVKQGSEVVFFATGLRNFEIAPGERCRVLGWNSKDGHEELIVPDGLLIHIRSYARAERSH